MAKYSAPDRPAPSPCAAVCVMDQDSGFCHGCYRTLEEIGRWMLMDENEKWALLADLDERRIADGQQPLNWTRPGRSGE